MLHQCSITKLRALLDNKEISATELIQHFLKRINAHDKQINSLISILNDKALKDASNAEKIIALGEQKLLTGIPIIHKDIFCTQGFKTSAGSKMLDNFISPYDATVVQKISDISEIH